MAAISTAQIGDVQESDAAGNSDDPVMVSSIAFSITASETVSSSSNTVAIYPPNTGASIQSDGASELLYSITSSIEQPSEQNSPTSTHTSLDTTSATSQLSSPLGLSSPSLSLTMDGTVSTDLISPTGDGAASIDPSNPNFVSPTSTVGPNPALNPTRVASPTTTLVASTRPHVTTATTSSAASTTTPTNVGTLSNGGSKIVPIVAAIVPLLIIVLCAFLIFAWRRRRNIKKKQQAKLEGEINQGTGQSLSKTIDESSASTTEPQGQKHSTLFATEGTGIGGNGLQKALMRKKPNLPPLLIAKHHNDTIQEESDENLSNTVLEDPFLTPSNQTINPDHDHNKPHGLDSSQIGLAITTWHNRNASNISVADSIRTVLHHASHKFSNPFRDPSKALSQESLTQPEYQPNTDSIIVAGAGDVTPTGVHQNPTDDKTVGTGSEQKEGLTKSTTPPEELAERCLGLLRMEAAQAQEAALQAAMKAAELRKNDNLERGNDKDEAVCNDDGDSMK